MAVDVAEVTKSPECEDCIKFVQDVKVRLFGDAQKKKVISELKKYICTNLIIGQQECDDVVERLVPKVLDMFGDKFIPEQICHGFCRNGHVTDDIGSEQVLMQKVIVIFANVQSSASSDQCHICKQVFDDVQHLVQDKSTQTIINDVVKKHFCPLLYSYSRHCEIVVDDYSQYFYEFLSNELDSSTRCNMFGFCNASNALKFLPFEIISQHLQQKQQQQQNLLAPHQQQQQHDDDENKVSNPGCEICKYVIDEIKKFIGKNATEEKIIEAFDKICYKIPKPYEKKCLDIINTYGRTLVELLLKGISSHDVCESIQLCSEPPMPPKNGKCEVCEIALQYVVSLLDQNATVAQVETLIKKVCHLLPPSMQQQCSEIVDEFGGLIIHYLATSLSPQQICKILNLCNSQQNAKLYYKCIAGPSFWCASKQNAKICQAEEHCLKNAWNKIGGELN